MKRGRKITLLTSFIALGVVLLGIHWLRGPTYEGRTVASWLEDLDNDSADKVEKAAAAIKALGTDALPTMLAELKVKDPKWKEKLMEWMENQSWFESRLTPAEKRRQRAREAFDILGDQAAPVIPQLIAMLADVDLNDVAEDILASMGPSSIEPLIAALRSENPIVRTHAASVLGNFEPQAARIAPALTPLRKDPDRDVRSETIIALWRLTPKEAVPLLTDALNDPDKDVRLRVVGAAMTMGPEGANAVPAIMLALKDPEVEVRIRAIYSLSSIQIPETLVQTLCQCLEDASPKVRYAAIRVLDYFGPKAQAAIPAITKLCEDKTSSGDYLGGLGTDSLQTLPWRWAGTVVPSSVSSTIPGSNNSTLGEVAKRALAKIDPAIAIPVHLADLKDPDDGIRSNAILALADFRKHHETIVPVLLDCLQDKKPLVKYAAIRALEGFGPDAKTAVPALIQLLQDKSPIPTMSAPGTFPTTLPPAPVAINPSTGQPIFAESDIGTAAREALKKIDPAAVAGGK